jgi:hypothetical protein
LEDLEMLRQRIMGIILKKSNLGNCNLVRYLIEELTINYGAEWLSI